MGARLGMHPPFGDLWCTSSAIGVSWRSRSRSQHAHTRCEAAAGIHRLYTSLHDIMPAWMELTKAVRDRQQNDWKRE